MRSPPKLSSLRNNRIFLLFLALVLFVSSDCAAAEDAKPERSYRLFAENAVARQAVLQLARDNLVDIYQVRKGHYIDFKTSHSIVEGLKKRFVVEETTLQGVAPSLYEGYTSNQGLVDFFNATVARWPTKARYFSIGKSALGKDIWVLELHSKVGLDGSYPSVKFVANQHGDEVVGRELVLRLATWLLENYEKETRAKEILDGIRLFLMPSMNPDGFEKGTRENAARVDLNRNFPDQWRSPADSPDGRQPETQAVMAWLASHNFLLSANMHGGEIVVNYPFDANARGAPVDTPTGDDDIFRYVSLRYASLNPDMKNHREFPGGITNGADWYNLFGGMQDYNYLWHGCMEVTLELSMNKWPTHSDIDYFWSTNHESMLAFIETASILSTDYHGVRGSILDSDSGAPIAGKVVVGRADATDDAARPFAVRTSPVTGWYFRILTPGRWRVTASAPGYSASSRIVDVPEGKYSLAHFQLTREGAIPDKVPTSSGGRPALGISLDTSNSDPYSVGLFFSALLPIGVIIYYRFRR